MNTKSTAEITEIAEQLIEDFSYFDSWEDRYAYVIECGKSLPSFNETYRTEDNKVHGCTSQVWLYTTNSPENPEIITYIGDSDAHIVKGLLAILLKLFSNQPKNDIVSFDISNLLKKLDLQDHLSPNRANGFFSMVKRIKELAATT